MRRTFFLAVLMIGMLLLNGCSNDVQGNMDWLPSQDSLQPSKETDESAAVSQEGETVEELEKKEDFSSLKVHTVEKLRQAIEEEKIEQYADMVWDNQRVNGLYNPVINESNGKNVLTYYFSSSEGDDANDGLSLEKPKKTLDAVSGVSNIHIYLKTDDVFQMKNTFYIGDNVLVAAYGTGARPKLDYYQPVAGEWKQLEDYVNVWVLDLKEEEGIYKKLNTVEDCNIGHLLIDGERNWKRKEKELGDVFNYAQYLIEKQDDSWAVDWENGFLYLYIRENPNDKEIAYAHPGFAFSIGNVQNVCISGLEITGVGLHAMALSNVKDIEISNCYIHHIGGSVLKRLNVRYGNAVELWDSGENVTVKYNVSEWIYDTCYTAQGSATNTVQRNIAFCNNLGNRSFAGLEIWGDGYSENPFENISYNDNILLNACDVTVPNVIFYAKDNGLLVKPEEYSGYRSGTYPYHQMSLLNTGTNREYESLEINGNFFWGTQRFLGLFLVSSDNGGYPNMLNNVFVETDRLHLECLYRNSDTQGTIYYVAQIPREIKNKQIVFEWDMENEILVEKIDRVIGEMANGVE